MSDQQNVQFIKNVASLTTAQPTESDLARWVASGAKILEQQQGRLQKAESTYAVERARMVEHYRARMHKVATEGEAELRAFDTAHRANARMLAHEIEQLSAMRDAAEQAQ